MLIAVPPTNAKTMDALLRSSADGSLMRADVRVYSSQSSLALLLLLLLFACWSRDVQRPCRQTGEEESKVRFRSYSQPWFVGWLESEGALSG